ncbi:MAG: hypothetical protein Q7J17_07410, partial [Candidatus Deferrimicrobium sp.]|nr:hypothetical protein [Candidatus Deferrimicrobium sp.]
GHLQIEQNQVVVVIAMQGADGMRIPRRRNARIAGTTQHLLKQPHIGFLIVYDQNAGVKNIGGTHHHRIKNATSLAAWQGAGQQVGFSP